MNSFLKPLTYKLLKSTTDEDVAEPYNNRIIDPLKFFDFNLKHNYDEKYYSNLSRTKSIPTKTFKAFEIILDSDSNSLKLSDDLIKSIEKLTLFDALKNLSSYAAFFNTWGTHYYKKLTYGYETATHKKQYFQLRLWR